MQGDRTSRAVYVLAYMCFRIASAALIRFPQTRNTLPPSSFTEELFSCL